MANASRRWHIWGVGHSSGPLRWLCLAQGPPAGEGAFPGLISGPDLSTCPSVSSLRKAWGRTTSCLGGDAPPLPPAPPIPNSHSRTGARPGRWRSEEPTQTPQASPVQGLLAHDVLELPLVFLPEAPKLIAGAELVSRGAGELDVKGRGGEVNLGAGDEREERRDGMNGAHTGWLPTFLPCSHLPSPRALHKTHDPGGLGDPRSPFQQELGRKQKRGKEPGRKRLG